MIGIKVEIPVRDLPGEETPDIKFFNSDMVITDYVASNNPIDLSNIEDDIEYLHCMNIVFDQINCVIPRKYFGRVMIFFCNLSDVFFGNVNSSHFRWIYFPLEKRISE